MFVILNEVKNLIISTESITEILRLTPQSDITTQSPKGEGDLIIRCILGLRYALCALRSYPPATSTVNVISSPSLILVSRF